MKRIDGFWEGTRAYAETIRQEQLQRIVVKNSQFGTLADLLAPVDVALFTNRPLSIADLLRQ